jgi:hypothetical protein
MPDTLVVVIIHRIHSLAIFPTHLSSLIELALSKNYWPRSEKYIRMGKERNQSSFAPWSVTKAG